MNPSSGPRRAATPAQLDDEVEGANRLVTDHLHLVQRLVSRVSAHFPAHVERQELWSSGAAGLVEAARRYDPDSGVPFARYASIRIRGAILDSTRTRDWATRAVRRDLRAMRASTEAFEQERGRAPTTDELAEQLGVEPGEVTIQESEAATATLLHLDQRVAVREEGDATLGELLAEADRASLPEEAIEDRELVGTLLTAVGLLPDTQREVVARHYLGGELLGAIAVSMAVTEARVSQIRAEGVNALREYFGSAFEGVPAVDDSAPGRRGRIAFSAAVSETSTWRDRLAAYPDPR